MKSVAVQSWECVVIGGGAAGLSAALVLGRARRRTLVVDAGRQSNLPAHGIGGLLGNDQTPPTEFYTAGRRELAAYPSVEVRRGTVTGAAKTDAGFALTLEDGTLVNAERVLLATGMDYRHRPLDGIDGLWGDSVFHCPFCHGWEARERALGVLDDGDSAVHRALLLRAWSDDITLLTDGPSQLDAAQRAQLHEAGVVIDERPVEHLVSAAGTLEAVAFSGGEQRAVGGLLIGVTLHARDDLVGQLGAELAPPNPMTAGQVLIDQRCQTSVAGLYAAGDVSPLMPSVAAAVASGGTAAAMMVQAAMALAPA